MDDYTLIERGFIEKQLLNELNDIESISRRNSRQIQNYSRPNSNNRICFSEGINLSRQISGNRETEKIIITKSGKKRIFRSV